MSEENIVDLEQLRGGIGCLTAEQCGAAYQAVQVALAEAGHVSEVSCEVKDRTELRFTVVFQWTEPEERAKKRSWRQIQRCIEWAAEGIAFLLVEEFTRFTVVEQAETAIAPGIDYYLGMKGEVDCDSEEEFPTHAARLEVSGILKESRGNSMRTRVQEKIDQTKQSDAFGTPAIIIVIEFSAPAANLTERKPAHGSSDGP